MDQEHIYENGRKPGQYQDYDKAQAEFRAEFSNMPPEVHHRHEEEYRQDLIEQGRPDLAEKYLNGPIVLEDEAQRKLVESAIAQSTPEELARAKNPDTDLSSGGATGSEPDVNNPLDPNKPRKPSSIEDALSAVQASPRSQHRLVISGDPVIRQQFYDALAKDNKLFYRGGQPVITTSLADAKKYLDRVTNQHPEAKAVHALSMSFDRDVPGLMENIKKTLFERHRYDRTDVFVVGNEATRSEKLKELGDFTKLLSDSKSIDTEKVLSGDKKGFQTKDGMLVVPESGPVTVMRGNSMYDMLNVAKEVAIRFQTAEAEKKQLRDEFKSNQDDARRLDSENKQKAQDGSSIKATGSDTLTASGPASPEPKVNRLALDLSSKLSDAYSAKEKLLSKDEDGRYTAVSALFTARKFKDPSEAEVSTLPDDRRQTFVAQLAATVAVADSKGFQQDKDDKRVSLDVQKDGVTVRDRIDSLVAAEVARDPAFPTKSKALFDGLVRDGVITEKQAEAANNIVNDGVVKVAREQGVPETQAAADKEAAVATSSEPSKAAKQAATGDQAADNKQASPEVIPASAQEAAGSKQPAEQVAAADSQAGVQPSPQPESTQGKDGAASGAQPGVSTTTEAASVANSQETAERPQPEASVAADKAVQADQQQAPTKEVQEPPRDVDMGSQLREVLSQIDAEKGKPNSNLVASTLYAAEDLRHFTVAALDNRTGDAPTKTLEKLDALVQASLKGEHGPEAQEVAQDTKTLVERWKLEDAERVTQESGANGAQRASEKATDVAQPTSPASEKDASASNQQVDAALGSQKDASASTAPALDSVSKDSPAATGAEAATTAEKQPDTRAEEAPQEQQVAPTKEAASATALGAESAAPQAQDPAQQSAVAADKLAAAEQPVFDPDREAKQQRFAETEIAAGKLAMLMDNPAGSFTNRDKSWNEGKIQEAADLVMRLDPESVSQMSAKQRGAVMEYGSWLAMNAYGEKLPGFDSPDGKAKAEAMANHVAQIISKFEGPTEVSPGVTKSLEKADRMVTEKERMSLEAERSGVSTPEAAGAAPTKRQAAESFAKDLVHMVYQKSELSEADIKYAMKGASQLTPQTMKQLSPELKAQATTALEFLAKEVRDGALGDFSSLLPAVKKNAIGAQQTVNTLNAEFSRDSRVTTEMIKATEALPVLGGAGSSAESNKAPAKGLDQGSGQDQVKSAGRELDR